jgi:hypothetical protein
MNIQKLQKLQKLKIKQLIENEWLPTLNREYIVEKKKFFHRESEEVNKIEGIEEIFNKLKIIWTPIEIMEFTKQAWDVADGDIPGPQKEFHSLLTVMYQLTEGLSHEDMNQFIKSSTYKRIFEHLFGGGSSLEVEEKRKKWQNWCNDWFDRFSTDELRSIFAKLNNPELLKSITTLIDGKDFVTQLQNIQKELRKTENDKSNLISRKNRKGASWLNAAKTVNLMTIEGYPWRNTAIVGANEKYDGKLAEDIKILKVMKKSDCILLDHHFDKWIKFTFSENNIKNTNLENPFDSTNYLLKPVKRKNIDFTPDETNRLKQISALLSKIESELNARIGKKVKLFNGSSKKRWVDFKQFHCVLQIGYVLIGINKFVIENQLLENYKDDLIHLENISLDYNFDYEEIEDQSEQIINQNDIITRQQENQNSFLNSLLENISSSEEEDEDEDEENSGDNFQNTQNSIE